MKRVLVAALLIASVAARGADVKAGTPIPFEVELSPKVRAMAMLGGNLPVQRAKCAIALPEKFSPSRPWPIVIVNASIGTSAVEVMKDYAPAASAAGWVTLAAEGATPAKLESTEWCHAMLIAAFEHLGKSWPGVARWPVATAGFSGGAKRSAYIGAVMIEDGHPLAGMFMGGCNEDRATDALRWHKPGPAFFKTPVFLSHGTEDRLASADATEAVVNGMKRSGFLKVRSETFGGGHEFRADQFAKALAWFRSEAQK
jgi:hypothetical protein